MKQGRASQDSASGRKREPTSHAVNVDAVADIGIKEIERREEPLFQGRGYKAPMAQSSTHRSGSQGKHK